VKARNWFVRRKYVVVGLLVVVASAVAVTAAIAASFEGAKTEHWGVILRNTQGSAFAELRDGPYVNPTTGNTAPGVGTQPPFGKGSLGIAVGGNPEKVAFGNEVDFYGDPVSDLTAVGYRVFQTGEDQDFSLANLPNITLEINPNVTGTDGYTSMVWVPGALTPADKNHWTGYIDATMNGAWYFTGGEGTTTSCSLSTPCTFATAKQRLVTFNNGSPAIVYSVAIAKGTDNPFQGAVDGLRLNNKVYDFEDEPDGVKEKGV
jgi:hypothetical protein